MEIDPRRLIYTATTKDMAKTVADKVQWTGAESELQFSPSELLQGHYECVSLFMQVDAGRKFFTQFSSSGEPNYLHYCSFGCSASLTDCRFERRQTKEEQQPEMKSERQSYTRARGGERFVSVVNEEGKNK